MSVNDRDDASTRLSLNGDHFVCEANDLIKGRQSMTLNEARLLYILISQVVKEDKDFRTYTVDIPTLAEFMEVSQQYLYDNIKKITNQLMQRVVHIRDYKSKKENWTCFQWVSYAKYDNGVVTLRLHDEVKPYILNLESHYSQIYLESLLKFNSYYTCRMFQLLRCFRGEKKTELFWTVKDIREYFDISEKKYTIVSSLIKNTIEVAYQELNSCDDIAFSFEYEVVKERRKGNPVSGIKIFVKTRYAEDNVAHGYRDDDLRSKLEPIESSSTEVFK